MLKIAVAAALIVFQAYELLFNQAKGQ